MRGSGVFPQYLLQAMLLLGLLLWGNAASLASTDQPDRPLTLTHGAIGLDKLSNLRNGEVIGGFKYDLIEEMGRRLNLPTNHVVCPFQRCLRDMKSGIVNIMVFIAVTPSRSHYLDFLHPWPVPYTIPFHVRLGEEDRLQRYEDFYKLNVGVVNGYSYFDRFDNDERIQKTVVLKEAQLPKMLSANRIDAYVGFNIGKENLEQEYPEITTAPYTHKFSETALLAISKGSSLRNHLPDLNKVVQDMIDDGTMDEFWHNNFQGYSPPYYNGPDSGDEQQATSEQEPANDAP